MIETPDLLVETIVLPKGPRCAACTHSIPAENRGMSFCRRFPPVPFMVGVEKDPQGNVVNHQQVSVWPIVNNMNWCGEFAEKGPKLDG